VISYPSLPLENPVVSILIGDIPVLVQEYC